MDAEDYLPVTGTYPEHPMSKREVKFKTTADFHEEIKRTTREDLEKKKRAWDDANPSEVPQKFILSEFLVTNPPHKLKSEIRKEKHRLDREKCGLTSHEEGIAVESGDPTLKFVNKPERFSNLELKGQRREDMLGELKKLENSEHIDSLQRLMEREECVRLAKLSTCE